VIITATSIVGRTISWNPDEFICTIQDKTKDAPDEKSSKVLSVFTNYNVKEMNITIEEAERILGLLKSLESSTISEES
jgi:hypothetical protein